MCVVRRDEIQLSNETRRRQRLLLLPLMPLMPLLLLLLLLGACGTKASDAASWATPWPDSTLDDCNVEYMLASANASNIYASAYELCELTANETQHDLSIDEQLERQQIELGRSTLCGNFDQCDALDDDLEYIECVKNQGGDNLRLITEINRNATSAYTRLRQDYDTVQQTLALCTLEAKVAYLDGMRAAHEQLQLCRSEVVGTAE